MGIDGISPKILSFYHFDFAFTVTNCINACFNNSIYEDCLKTSLIIPTLKKGDPNLITNYRPIANINNLSKVFENVIFNQMYNYIDANSLFFNHQYGFRKGYSTEHCILSILNCIHVNNDSNYISICIFLDLSKFCKYFIYCNIFKSFFVT